jgi:DNA-binding PadR family transcriptional regulator
MPLRRRPVTTDRYARTNLELFVLAAVRAGLDSAYDLNKSADLSVGATLPLLSRLEKAGLLRSKAAARRSKQYSVTAEGRSVLQRSWQKLLEPVPREFEAILRIAYVCAVMDGTLKVMRYFLRAAAVERKLLGAERKRKAESILRESVQDAFGRGHRWLRAYCDFVRLEAETSVLSRLGARKDLVDILRARQS